MAVKEGPALRVIAFPRSTKPAAGKDSPFLLKMRELEMASPEHARVFLDLASSILQERRDRVWSWDADRDG